jgi:hypothetical protein
MWDGPSDRTFNRQNSWKFAIIIEEQNIAKIITSWLEAANEAGLDKMTRPEVKDKTGAAPTWSWRAMPGEGQDWLSSKTALQRQIDHDQT